MINLEKTDLLKESTGLVQLKNLSCPSVFITDPEGKRLEIKTKEDGTQIVCTEDETGKKIGIEERTNGTKVYHISADSTGLPSSHEVRADLTEIIYFYNETGKLEHFVELKTNGDRVSTVIGKDGAVYTIEQKQIGGIKFQAWLQDGKDGMFWLHSDGEISSYGDEDVLSILKTKFKNFLDGVS